MGAFGMPPMLLCQTLTERSPATADTARSALMFLFIRNMIRQLRILMPDSHFELLEHPVAGP